MLKHKKNLIVIFIIFLYSCGGQNSDVNSTTGTNAETKDSFSYRSSTQEELNEIKIIWAQRDLSAKEVSIAYEHTEGEVNVKIYEHKVGSNKHYGAIITPTNPSNAKLPVELSLDGLDQTNPSITIENNLLYFKGNTVLVVPAFRGRTMRYNGLSFVADGDSCDAWDGATDDTIALVNVLEATTPLANMKRILATGYSRGGNIALLMAERDSRIHTVIDGAGPVDFYRNEVKERYGYQYQCQFFDNKTESQARQKMLSSSPLRFNFLPNVKQVYIFHGGNDTTVPLWNPAEMNAHLLTQGISAKYFIYDGFGHGDIWKSQNFLNAWNQAHDDFRNGVYQ